jgi:hypothetical protein
VRFSLQNRQVKAGLTGDGGSDSGTGGSHPQDQDQADPVACGRGGAGLTCSDSGQGRPEPSDRDLAVLVSDREIPNFRMRIGKNN